MDFTGAEKAVLTTLDESGLRLPPSVIAENTGYAADYIRQVCKDLLDEGFIENAGSSTNPYYTVTDRGSEAISDVDEHQ